MFNKARHGALSELAWFQYLNTCTSTFRFFIKWHWSFGTRMRGLSLCFSAKLNPVSNTKACLYREATQHRLSHSEAYVNT